MDIKKNIMQSSFLMIFGLITCWIALALTGFSFEQYCLVVASNIFAIFFGISIQGWNDIQESTTADLLETGELVKIDEDSYRIPK